MLRYEHEARPLDCLRHGARDVTTLALTTLLCTMSPGAAHATEHSATSRALGIDTILIGVMPPPGSARLLGTFAYYRATEITDTTGGPRPDMPNFHVDSSFVNLRLSYVWPGVEFLGAHVETRAGAAVYGDVRVGFDMRPPLGTGHISAASGELVPAITLSPVLLGWHTSTFHQIAGLQFVIPTQSIDTTQLVNVSSGYASIIPVYYATWFPREGVEVNGTFSYAFNGSTKGRDYRAGQEFSMDYAGGYSFAPGWQAGLNGYFYAQTTDDTRNGARAGDGNRGRVFSIGPYLRYLSPSGWGVAFKWMPETSAENRTRGNRLMLQVGKAL